MDKLHSETVQRRRDVNELRRALARLESDVTFLADEEARSIVRDGSELLAQLGQDSRGTVYAGEGLTYLRRAAESFRAAKAQLPDG
jgi:hypothetical protein